MKKVLVDEHHLKTLIESNHQLNESNLKLSENVNSLLQIIEENYVSKHQWIDCQEVCNFLYISKNTLKHYRQENLISYTDFEGKLLYDKLEIEQHLEKHIHKAK